MSPTAPSENRWDGYVLRGPEDFVSFWRSLLHSGRRDLLFVLGRGFDPRMCNASETILALGGDGVRHCLQIKFNEGPVSPSTTHDALLQANVRKLEKLFSGKNCLWSREINMWSSDGLRRVGPRRAAEAFDSFGMIGRYTDVLVDISALPRSLYMPILNKLLYLIDTSGGCQTPNLHVLTDDNPALDQLIVAEGLDDNATYLHGFESGIEQDATAHWPKVWMPTLGEGKIRHFESINELVKPDEIAPVLPFPCSNPRRTDNLILEYRDVLFDRLRVEATNLIHAPERNPFGVYREIVSAATHYIEAMQVLDGCKVVLSVLSSKLLSVGTLLAAYDLKQAGHNVGIAHVQAEGYRMKDESTASDTPGELFEMWIAGEPYYV